MRVLNEVRGHLGVFYDIFINGMSLRKIKVIRVIRKYRGFQYVFLLNSKGQVIQEVLDFLNNHCRRETINSREQMATALKFLYSFKQNFMQ